VHLSKSVHSNGHGSIGFCVVVVVVPVVVVVVVPVVVVPAVVVVVIAMVVIAVIVVSFLVVVVDVGSVLASSVNAFVVIRLVVDGDSDAKIYLKKYSVLKNLPVLSKVNVRISF